MDGLTPFGGLMILVVVWGSLFFALWLRGFLFDRKNKRDRKGE